MDHWLTIIVGGALLLGLVVAFVLPNGDKPFDPKG